MVKMTGKSLVVTFFQCYMPNNPFHRRIPTVNHQPIIGWSPWKPKTIKIIVPPILDDLKFPTYKIVFGETLVLQYYWQIPIIPKPEW